VQGVAQQAGNRHRPDAARYRRQGAGNIASFRGDVANDARLAARPPTG